jgi:hypothetical protein
MATLTRSVKVADECWIALALLHRENPKRGSFAASEILDRLAKEKVHPEHRAGIQVHIYLHNVANLPPNSARYRMFYRLEDGSYRLCKPGDVSHPDRRGKTKPAFEDLPQRYRNLLEWYETEYCALPSKSLPSQDPILSARGLGRAIWIGTHGDTFVRELRSGWDAEGSNGGSRASPKLSSHTPKNPVESPDRRGEKGGPCPKCGWPETVARRSRKTKELYFGCARPKAGRTKGCNFKGCRSH